MGLQDFGYCSFFVVPTPQELAILEAYAWNAC